MQLNVNTAFSDKSLDFLSKLKVLLVGIQLMTTFNNKAVVGDSIHSTYMKSSVVMLPIILKESIKKMGTVTLED